MLVCSTDKWVKNWFLTGPPARKVNADGAPAWVKAWVKSGEDPKEVMEKLLYVLAVQKRVVELVEECGLKETQVT